MSRLLVSTLTSIAAVVALTAGAVAPTAGASPTAPSHPPTSAAPQTLAQHVAVPSYFDPADTASWSTLESTASSLGFVIANVLNGPGSQTNPQWQKVINATHAAGTHVLGYVDTGYFGFTDPARQTALGDTDAASWLVQAERDVNRWYTLYGDAMGGVFFDDVENVCGPTKGSTQYVDLYRELTEYLHRMHPGSVSVLNPGITVPQCYEDAGDILATFEGSYSTFLNPPADVAPAAWQLSADPNKFWSIVYDVPQSGIAAASARSQKINSGYVYYTPRTLDSNPYLTAPAPDYWTTELASAPAASTARVTRPLPPIPTNRTATSIDLTLVSLPFPRSGREDAVAYDVYDSGSNVASVDATSRVTHRVQITGLQPASTHRYTVKARSRSGAESAASLSIRVATRAASGATPTTPTGLSAVDIAPTSARVSWNPSTVAHGPHGPRGTIDRYEVLLNGTAILSVDPSITSVHLGGLTPGESSSFTVVAWSTGGKASAESAPLPVTTPLPLGNGLSGPSATLNASDATFSVKYDLPFTFHHVFIDTDNDSSTGYIVSSGDDQLGAEFMIENSWLYKHVGDGWNWSQVSSVSPLTSSVDGVFTWTVPTAVLGTGVSTVNAIFNGTGSSPDAYSTTVTAHLGG